MRLNVPEMNPEKKELYTAKRASGLDTSSDANISLALIELKSDSSCNWILFTINGSSLEFIQKGEGGHGALITHLNDSGIFFGVLKAIVSGQVKFYNFSYIGENVSAMKRGKVAMYKSAVFSITEAHGEIQAPNTLAEFSAEYVLNQISRLSGTASSLVKW